MPSNLALARWRVSAWGLLAMVGLLAGCGYQLKGQFSFTEGLSPLVWQEDVDAEELYYTMRDTFALYGVVLGTRPADTLLRIHAEQASEVDLNDATVLGLEVTWSLVNVYGVSVISHRSTRVETRLSLSPEVDEDDARVERYRYLRNRIALRVLDQLEALSDADLNRKPEEAQAE